MGIILLAADRFRNSINPNIPELVSFALRIAESDDEIVLLIPSADGEKPPPGTCRGAGRIILLGISGGEAPDPAWFAREIRELVAEMNPRCVALMHSPRSALTAALLAPYMGASPVTAVEDLAVTDGCIHVRRSLYGGKLAVRMKSVHAPILFTLLPGAFVPKVDESPGDDKKKGMTAAPAVEQR